MNDAVLDGVLVGQEINVDELSENVDNEGAVCNAKSSIWVGELCWMVVNILHMRH